MLKINCKGKRTVGKANKEINVEKIIIVLKNQNLKKRKENKKGKLHRTAKAQCRDRFITAIKKMWLRGKKLKRLIRFHNANKIDNYNREGGKGKRKEKNTKESTEQIKT